MTSIESWVEQNYHLLQEKYSGKFIALVGEKIIAVGDSMEEVYSKAKLVTKEPIIIDFIEKGDLHAYNFEISTETT